MSCLLQTALLRSIVCPPYSHFPPHSGTYVFHWCWNPGVWGAESSALKKCTSLHDTQQEAIKPGSAHLCSAADPSWRLAAAQEPASTWELQLSSWQPNPHSWLPRWAPIITMRPFWRCFSEQLHGNGRYLNGQFTYCCLFLGRSTIWHNRFCCKYASSRQF